MHGALIEYTPWDYRGDGHLLDQFFNDLIVYMILGIILKLGGWVFIGIWVFLRINLLFSKSTWKSLKYNKACILENTTVIYIIIYVLFYGVAAKA